MKLDQIADNVKAVAAVMGDVEDVAPMAAAPRSPEAPRRAEASKSAGRARVAAFSAASLAGQAVPDRHWLAHDLIPAKTVTLLGGDGGTGKSLLALQLAVAVAAGLPWVGRTVAGGSVIYVSAEDDKDELHRRLADICAAQNLALEDLDRLTLIPLAGQDAILMRPNGAAGPMKATPLFAEITALARDTNPLLVVFDTLADNFGGNENDRAQARQFIGLLRGLALAQECAVLVLAHPSLSGLSSGSGTSGSTAWNNSVRSRLYLDRPGNDLAGEAADLRVLRCMKSNYAKAGQEIELQWRKGAFVPLESETGLDRAAAGSRAERVFMKLMRLMREQGRNVSPNPSASFAASLFADHPEAEGVTKKAFATAMERLLSAGKIRKAEFGPASRRSMVLEIAE